MLLLAKILLTVATLGYSALPAIVDSNSTHATNPSWDPHARFHVVWQVSSYVYIALAALALIWTAGENLVPLWIAAALAAGAYGGFWTAVFSRDVYGGTLVSGSKPVPDVKWNIAGRQFNTDANVTAFSVCVAVLLGGVLVLSST